MKCLLDTCVVSELLKKEPNHNVASWIDSQNEDDLYLSIITVGEFFKGISKLPDNDDRKINLINWLENDLLTRFENKILEIDFNIIKEWGCILGVNEKKGIVIPAIDSLIGVTAVVNDFILVTRNVKDFRLTNCNLKNPWKFS